MSATERDFATALARDIVATAGQYPAVRLAEWFADLHAVYDVNESILAAAEAVGVDLFAGQVGLDVANAATALVDDALRAGGWAALCRMADGGGSWVRRPGADAWDWLFRPAKPGVDGEA